MTSTNTRQKTERFRILIIGMPGAGKTTILTKVCHARGRDPKFLGAEIDSELNPSIKRGMYDIENQIVYPTAHGFIFHDSSGFDVGDTQEFVKVKEFINKRAKMSQMKDQLHAIWYCHPIISNDRPLTKAKLSFFEIDTGNGKPTQCFLAMPLLVFILDPSSRYRSLHKNGPVDEEALIDQLDKNMDLREAEKQVPSHCGAA